MIDPDELTKSEAADTARGRNQRVVVILPDGVTTYALRPGAPTTIGRAPDCDIRIDHPSVSRRHAVIHAGPPLFVEDVGSSNGTRLSGRRIDLRRPEIVPRGALVEVGIATLLLEGSEPFRADMRPSASSPLGSADSGERTMVRLHRLVELVAPGRLSILLLGETGVGKEVMAERIHRSSPRASGPFVPIHCAALPELLLESELFGHERGAFTNAIGTKAGLVETADGGTLLLDEIGELPLVTQAKLLRVLETREVLRLGAVKPRAVDVRFIAATHRDLDALIRAGSFRSDLYYRLNGMSISIPPLRDRIEEIPPLVEKFAASTCAEMGWKPPSITPAALAQLVRHSWPGNIRELRNVVERAVMLAAGSTLDVMHFPAPVSAQPAPDVALVPPKDSSLAPEGILREREPTSVPATLRSELADVERRRILDALERSGGNQRRAAELLGISRRTLLGRLDLYDLPRPRKKVGDAE